MTPIKVGANSAISNQIVPQESQLLHLLQVLKSLETPPITSFNDHHLKRQVQNLVHLEHFCGFIPIYKGTKRPPKKCKYAGEPHSTLEQALGFAPAALAIRSSNLLTLDYDKASAFDYVAERGIDFTFPTWHIRVTDQLWRYKQVFLVPDSMLLELPNGFIKRTINYEKAGLDIFLNNAGYIIFSGQHANQTGYYYSPLGLGVSHIKEPPKEVWDLVLEISKNEESNTRIKKYYPNSKSRRLDPCPICGRNARLWCSESDGGLIWCFKGSTFDAELKHGVLKIGDVVNGYALVATSDICNTFKLDQPRARAVRKVEIRRVHARR